MFNNLKNFDQLEKQMALFFGIIGTAAIFLNLHLKEYGVENSLDAVKDFAGLGAIIAVFFLASKFFNKLMGTRDNFNEIFEKHIETWAEDNKDLIDSSKMKESQSSIKDTRMLYMILDLTQYGEQPAESYGSKSKAAFLYLPANDNSERKNKIFFKINQQLFSKYPDYNVKKVEILNKIKNRIDSRFSGELSLKVKVLQSEDKVEVDFSSMEKTKDNALRLKDLVEHVKTLILALA